MFDFETSSNLAQFLPTNVVALFMYTYMTQEVVQGRGLDNELVKPGLHATEALPLF